MKLDRAYAIRERQNALPKQFNIQQLLDTQWEIIIQEGKITREFEGYFQVYVYLQELEKELQTISPNDYQGQKHLYDQRVAVLNNKIIEINTWLYNESTTKNYLSKSLINNGLIDSPNDEKDNILRKTEINTFLFDLWVAKERPNAKSLVHEIKPLVGKMNCPVHKYHGWYDEVCVEWKHNAGSDKRSWGKKTFQNKVLEFKKQHTK